MSALLTSVEGDKDNKPFYLNAARLMGIRVLPPDVNESVEHFAPAGEDVRYGLAAVRNVGEGAVQQIILARKNNGAFTSFKDFCEKVEPGVLHKKILESLILAGAFDSLGYTRRGLLEGYERVVTPILGRPPRRGVRPGVAVRRRRRRAARRDRRVARDHRRGVRHATTCSARRRRCSGST